MMTGMPTVNRDDFGNKHCLLKYSLTATPVKEVKAPRAADPCKRGHLKAKIEIDVYTVFADVCNLIHLRLRFPTFSPLKLILDRFALAQQNCIYYYNNIYVFSISIIQYKFYNLPGGISFILPNRSAMRAALSLFFKTQQEYSAQVGAVSGKRWFRSRTAPSPAPF